jgi:hypothetical protein
MSEVVATTTIKKRERSTNDELYEKAMAKRNAVRPEAIKRVVQAVIERLDTAASLGDTWATYNVTDRQEEKFLSEILATLVKEHGIEANEHKSIQGVIVVNLVPPAVAQE